MARTLIVPGLRGSGPDHWQAWWHAVEPGTVWVEQQDWNTPDLDRWAARIADALREQAEPAWIVAHSFGVLASIRAAEHVQGRIAGAFLVAPADPEKFGVSDQLPRKALPFPSLLVASSNDPWMGLLNAAYWANLWRSHFVNLGHVGHINPDSGFGPWIEGRALFRKFTRSFDGQFSGEIPLFGHIPTEELLHAH